MQCLADLAVREAERDRVEHVAFSGGQNGEALCARGGLVAAGVGVNELPRDAGRHDGLASSDDAYGIHEFVVSCSLDEEGTGPRAENSEGVLVQDRGSWSTLCQRPTVILRTTRTCNPRMTRKHGLSAAERPTASVIPVLPRRATL